MLGAALTIGVTPVEAKEIVYQAVPYVGMGRVFDFIQATNQILTDRGVELPLGGQATTVPEDRAEKGRAVQEQIVARERVQAMYDGARTTRCTSSTFCPPTASVTTWPAAGSTSRPGNC